MINSWLREFSLANAKQILLSHLCFRSEYFSQVLSTTQLLQITHCKFVTSKYAYRIPIRKTPKF